MRVPFLSCLLTLAALSLLFTAGAAAALLLRRSPALPPRGRRLLWIAVLLFCAVPLPLFTPAAELSVTETAHSESLTVVVRPADAASAGASAVSPAPPLAAVTVDGAGARLLHAAPAVLVSLWVILSTAVLAARLVRRRRGMRALRAHSRPCADGRVLDVCRRAAESLGMRAPAVRIFEAELPLSPCTAGVLSPAVYLPASVAAMPQETLSLILLHELSHIRAHDALLSLAVMTCAALHFSHPLSRRVEAAVAEDCEIAVDDAVLRRAGADARIPYMNAILDVAERLAIPEGDAALAAADRARSIERRFLSMQTARRSTLRAVLTICLIGALVFSNVFLFSACAVHTAAAPAAVPISNPVLRAALVEYFGLADERALTADLLGFVTSLSFTPGCVPLAEARDAHEFPQLPDGAVSVRIQINGTLLWDGEGLVTPGVYGRGFAFDTVPEYLDLFRFETMLAAVSSDRDRDKLHSFYTVKDPAAVGEDALAECPFARRRAAAILDPDAKPRELRLLAGMLEEAGMLTGRVLPDGVLDLSDLSRLPNLQRVDVADVFTPVGLDVPPLP